MICNKSDPDSLDLFVECLKKGGISIVPTDTVYGFSGIVDLAGGKIFKSDEHIRSIKGRSESKPLIQLISSPEEADIYSEIKIPDSILNKWPGPLTVIVPIKKASPYSEKMETVALRCPGDLWIRNAIKKCGAPVYSTSVNRSGFPVIEEIDRIVGEFSLEVDLIVKDGDKKGAVPSTIVSIVDGSVKVVRQGSIVV